jgi:hypothetical protein
MGDPQLGKIGRDLRRPVETETGMELDAVGGARHRHAAPEVQGADHEEG